MRIVIKNLNLIIEMNENMIDVIVFDRPKRLYEILANTFGCVDSDNKILLIDNDGTEIPTSQYDIVISPFAINLNNKKILNVVYKDLEQIIAASYFDKSQAINTSLVNLIEDAIFDLPYNISCEQVYDVKEIIKICNVYFEDNTDNLLEKITEYIKLQSKVLKIKCIVFINLRDFFSSDELELLYKEAFYQKVYLLMIESHEKLHNKYERIHIIDESDCIIEY